MNEKVSVIIPVFNGEKYIVRCLDSLTSQTYQNIEIIVVDDGSKDGTFGLIQEYLQKDPRVRCIHKANGGVSVARNLALTKASGEYVCFVDADDWVDKNMIEDNINTISKESSDMVINDYYLHCGDKISVCQSFPDNKNVDIIRSKEMVICSDSLNSPWLSLYRLSIIQQNNIAFPEDISSGEDHIFNIQYIDCICGVSYSRKAYYHYIIHNGSGCRKLRENQLEMYDKQHQVRLRYAQKWGMLTLDAQKYVLNLTATHLSAFVIMAQNCMTKQAFYDWMQTLYASESYLYINDHRDILRYENVPKTYKVLLKLLMNKRTYGAYLYCKCVNFAINHKR